MKEEFLKKEDVVTCEECKCLIKEEDAQKVLWRMGFVNDSLAYYCRQHRRNYEKVYNLYDGNHYFSELEVNKDGEPIGYKKIIKK